MLLVLCFIAAAILIFIGPLTHYFVPPPLPGIPHSKLSRWMPWGDLGSLAVHFIRTGQVFDWLCWQCVRQRSAVVQLFLPSFSTTSPIVIVGDVREIQDIVTRRGREFDRLPLMHDWFEVVMPEASIGQRSDDDFRRMRRLWNGMLSPVFLEEVMASAIGVVMAQLIELWTLKAQASPNGTFESCQDLLHAALESMWMALVGCPLGLMDAKVGAVQGTSTGVGGKGAVLPQFFRDFDILCTCIDWLITGFSLSFYKWFFPRFPVLTRARARAKSSIQTHIDDTRRRLSVEKGSAPQSAISIVLSRDMARNAADGVPDSALIDETLLLLVAGHESTGAAAAWSLKYLMDHPAVQRRLYDDLMHAYPEIAAGTTLGIASPASMAKSLVRNSPPYLEAIVEEVLRVAAAGPVSFRITMAECDVLGHTLPAGTPLVLMTAAPQYGHLEGFDRFDVAEETRSATSQRRADRRRWKCEDIPLSEFAPERWLDGAGSFDRDAGLSLPFSAGIRGCFGKRIATLELKVIIAMLVMSFDFPRLPNTQSTYACRDGLNRQPTCAYIRPVQRRGKKVPAHGVLVAVENPVLERS
jgi:cytochrome P450